MPAHIDKIIADMTSFYDFKDKTVVHVGAGGGQLIGYAPVCRQVVAVDNDPAAVARLESKIDELALRGRVSIVPSDFYDVEFTGDVALLEFCLHEMRDPCVALDQARAIAPEVVVIEHLPDSRWIWLADEDEDATRAWEAVEAAGRKKRDSYETNVTIDDYAQLEAKFAEQGEESLRRIAELRGKGGIVIPMRYGIALL